MHPFISWPVLGVLASTLVFTTVHCPHSIFLFLYYALLAGPLVVDRAAENASGNANKAGGRLASSEAQLIGQMKEAQARGESSLECGCGDQLKVIRFGDMVGYAGNRHTRAKIFFP